MSEAKIRIQIGSVIVECSPEDVDIVVRKLIKMQPEIQTIKIHKVTTRSNSISDFIIQLRNEGFFDNPKSLSEIKEAFRENGRKWNHGSVSSILSRLYASGQLNRNGNRKTYKYVKPAERHYTVS